MTDHDYSSPAFDPQAFLRHADHHIFTSYHPVDVKITAMGETSRGFVIDCPDEGMLRKIRLFEGTR